MIGRFLQQNFQRLTQTYCRRTRWLNQCISNYIIMKSDLQLSSIIQAPVITKHIEVFSWEAKPALRAQPWLVPTADQSNIQFDLNVFIQLTK